MNPTYFTKTGRLRGVKPGHIWYENKGYRPFVEGEMGTQVVAVPTLPHMVPTVVQQPVETL